MDDGQEQYIRQVLEAYRKTPGTMGTIRRPDRVLAAQLFQRGVSVSVIENAFVLAATRRLVRPADAAPLGTIRSLAYFLPVIDEVIAMRVSPDYVHYVRRKLERIAHDRLAVRAVGADDGTPAPHAFGVDNTACSFPSQQEHAFGVDDGPLISLPFPVPFSAWVTAAERYWSTLAKRPRIRGICMLSWPRVRTNGWLL
jgi:hypothetical protein